MKSYVSLWIVGVKSIPVAANLLPGALAENGFDILALGRFVPENGRWVGDNNLADSQMARSSHRVNFESQFTVT